MAIANLVLSGVLQDVFTGPEGFVRFVPTIQIGNSGSADTNTTVQWTDASNANQVYRLVKDLPVAPKDARPARTGPFALMPGDKLQGSDPTGNAHLIASYYDVPIAETTVNTVGMLVPTSLTALLTVPTGEVYNILAAHMANVNGVSDVDLTAAVSSTYLVRNLPIAKGDARPAIVSPLIMQAALALQFHASAAGSAEVTVTYYSEAA